MSYRRSLFVLMLMLAVLFAACASAAGGDLPAQMREIETTTAETTTETTTEETTTEKLLTPVDVNVMMIGAAYCSLRRAAASSRDFPSSIYRIAS